VLTGEVWEEFCDELKAAGGVVFAPGAPSSTFDRAEGFRYLTRLLRGGLENFLECADVRAPRLCSIANGMRAAPVKLGSDNPDNLYQSATIDARLVYLVTGQLGTVPYVGFGTQSGEYGGSGGRHTVAYLEASQLIYDDEAKSRFRLVLAAEYTPELQLLAPNWLRLKLDPPEAMFVVRETFGNRTGERPMTVSISCWGAPDEVTTELSTTPSSLSTKQLCKALQSTTLMVAGASSMFAKWARDFQQHTNQLPLFDQQRSDQAGGDPNIRYFHSYWTIPDGMALVLTVEPPVPCQSWNFQVNNHWMESLDYRYHKVHTNSVLATPEETKSGAERSCPCFSIVLAHEGEDRRLRRDQTWLSTTGHNCGTMCFRFVFSAGTAPTSDQLPHPRISLVPLTQLISATEPVAARGFQLSE